MRVADRQLVLHALSVVLAVAFATRNVCAQRFYPDDPLPAEPAPVPVVNPERRALSEILERINNTVGRPGERHPDHGVIAAGAVNTLGEVIDSDWFVNRHATRRLTAEELVRGSGTDHPPADGPLRVVELRPHGARPGIFVADARGESFFLMFDPPGHLEMATGSQMVSSRFAHAMGYFVPECYLIDIDAASLTIGEDSEIVSSAGNRRVLRPLDLEVFLRQMARTPSRRYRAVAMYTSPPEWRAYLGPFQLFAQRSDDPNDIVVHEHRRDLRGLFVISAWLNHSAMRAVTTVDVLADIDGIPRIRHYLADFFATLGSGYREAKRAWDGNEPLLDVDRAFKNAVGFGIWSPAWMRERFPAFPAVGRFAASTFDPERWSPTERLAPFENRLPDDEYWGAKQVLSFSDADIATIVGVGRYSDPAAAAWIAKTLIERRNRIATTYLRKVLPLDRFRIEGGALQFDDLAVRYHVVEEPATYDARWFRFDNTTDALTPLATADGMAIPQEVSTAGPGSYFAVRVDASARSPGMDVTVYLRARPGVPEVVGIERGWPGKVIVDPRDKGRNVTRFDQLTPGQQHLYEGHARRDMAARGRTMTIAEHFDSQTISARTTFDSVTHALARSALTDETGASLGSSFDLLAGLDRVAGQYQGRGGDEQFRLFVELDPKAVETLGRATEFFRDHDNTVFHVGFPQSFRQVGSVPNIQFSVSEDGTRADIDVDYRSSRIPQGLFNGHLSAANSDVRAGNNLDRHNRRWAGFVAWWRGIFGTVPADERSGVEDDAFAAAVVSGELPPTPLPPDRPLEALIAEPQDAIVEFLADWLVRHDVDQALGTVSGDLFACVNIDDDRQNEPIRGDDARRILRDAMHTALDEMDRPRTLTGTIEAPDMGSAAVVPHAFAREFALMVRTPDEAVTEYLSCEANVPLPSNNQYYSALFRFRRSDSAVLGVLWVRDGDRWRLRSYRLFET